MPYVRDVRPLVGPAKGDGDLRPGAIARVGVTTRIILETKNYELFKIFPVIM